MKKKINKGESFKVLFFASTTYEQVLIRKLQKRVYKKNKKYERLDIEDICVNLKAIEKVYDEEMKAIISCKTGRWSDTEKHQLKIQYMKEYLDDADMICSTFGNSMKGLLKDRNFTHIIADECNQSSLETYIGLIPPVKIKCKLKFVTMAGDINQLKPVSHSGAELAKKSVYEYLISYLISGYVVLDKIMLYIFVL